jgi:hypothetical protein
MLCHHFDWNHHVHAAKGALSLETRIVNVRACTLSCASVPVHVACSVPMSGKPAFLSGPSKPVAEDVAKMDDA